MKPTMSTQARDAITDVLVDRLQAFGLWDLDTVPDEVDALRAKVDWLEGIVADLVTVVLDASTAAEPRTRLKLVVGGSS